MKKLILICFVLFFLSFASAEVQSLPHPARTNFCVNLPQSFANSTYQNITVIQLPDESLLSINSPMNNIGGGYFNYTFCNTSINGHYIVNGIGDVDGLNQAWNYEFVVNPLGQILTQGQAILYFLIFIVSFILFLVAFGAGIYIPADNDRDQMTGYILAVSNRKYIKMFMLGLSYMFFLLVVYFGWIISYGYLDLDSLGNLFSIAFYALAWLTLPLFVICTYIIIANKVRDTKIGDLLSRGLTAR